MFEAGLTNDFESLVLSSEFIITTSITEGFGFSFLEPWTAKKMLWGRKLPDICEDFEKNGVQLDHLYTTLNIPIGWTSAGSMKSGDRVSGYQSSGTHGICDYQNIFGSY